MSTENIMTCKPSLPALQALLADATLRQNRIEAGTSVLEDVEVTFTTVDPNEVLIISPSSTLTVVFGSTVDESANRKFLTPEAVMQPFSGPPSIE